ncbi:hypothetical protein [Jiangella rhizosphaerae]|uniref:Lipoprotein n=1 Tax=Jiangella rhizosphaerae TaxID=2293569 RepID=A0A418KS09_9ACTN|nr:hypothetical protein [Jiangella rhizosphaerae]RIQ26278.1 hypothetical protein DY240_10515 [Jiangella rhizosphaerae]
MTTTGHHRAGPPARRFGRAAALAAIAVLALTACSGDDEPGTSPSASESGDGPRPLTGDEAQRLSMMRYTNYTDGVRGLSFEVVDNGRTFTVDGWADFAQHVGYAHVSQDGSDPELVAWTLSQITSHAPVGPATDDPPLPPPDDTAWTSSTLAPEQSRLHAMLALVFQAASDRPDNPLLLQQTDARWLRSDEVDGVRVDVVAGPTADRAYDPATATTAADGSDATVRYWVDEEGRLLRLEARLGGTGDWTAVDFTDAPGVDFAGAFLTTTASG